MTAILGGVLILVIATALGWLALCVRFYLRLDSFMPVEAVTEPCPLESPAIEAIIAARNEEDHVKATVESLLNQEYPRLSIIAVDDQSTDATLEILTNLEEQNEDGRLRVIAGGDRPEGWVGKTWALHRGVSDSVADWLLFVDADMGLHPHALATAMHHARRTQADLVSLLPRPECTTFWQGSIALAVVQLLSHRFLLDLVNNPERPEALASGGFILVRRAAYDRAGGHIRLRRAIMDDIELARRVKQAGGKLFVAPAPRLAGTHMYGSLGDIWRGLRKNAYAVMNYRFYKYAIGAMMGLALVWGPVLGLAVGTCALFGFDTRVPGLCLLLAGGLGLMAQAVATYPFARFLQVPVAMAFSSVAGLSLYIAIATSSVWHHLRGRVVWKDRTFTSGLVKTRVPYEADKRPQHSAFRAEGPNRLPEPHSLKLIEMKSKGDVALK